MESPTTKRRRTTLGSLFSRFTSAWSGALFRTSTAGDEDEDDNESSGIEELESDTEASEDADAEMTAAEQDVEPEAFTPAVQVRVYPVADTWLCAMVSLSHSLPD